MKHFFISICNKPTEMKLSFVLQKEASEALKFELLHLNAVKNADFYFITNQNP